MNLLATAELAASEAMKIAAVFLNDPQVLSAKGKDIKTLADLQMNEVIVKHLAKTGIAIFSEEIDDGNKPMPDHCWIVDPLDGTYNFSRKFPCAAISICLWQNGVPVTGIVKDIFSGQTYIADSGHGSRLQNNVIHVSKTGELADAVLATGFPSGGSYETASLMAFVTNVQQFKKIRAIGAASLMLAHVANGIFDVYYEKDIYLWDVAAGLSLVKNAGGDFFIRQNGATAKYEVLASNAVIFEKAKALLIH
jgi:myo-inositol-1(or 4)-monophosphatase